MKPTTFDEIVKKRASQRVQSRLTKFRTDIREAFSRLGVPRGSATYAFSAQATQVLQMLIDGENNRWPTELWQREEEAVAAELLDTMDEMQKAFLAPEPGPDQGRPLEETS